LLLALVFVSNKVWLLEAGRKNARKRPISAAMLGSLREHSTTRCKRLKSVLCVGCTALCISLTAVFISDFSNHCELVMQHLISQRAV
jgi:hypothetical protein